MKPASSKPRYLTKSIFKSAMECPTKLSYIKKKEYPNTKQGNLFLKALAEGGFQVGELAKLYHPGGIQIETLNSDEAVAKTNELLQQKSVVLYEAAFRFEDCLIRADIVVKTGNCIDLIEVKAKSASGDNPQQFWNKDGKSLNSTWEPYLLDIAFQKWVVSKAKPEFVVTPFLMLADKEKTATTDGMSQKFFIISKPGDTNLVVEVAPGTTKESLGAEVLSKIEVDSEVAHLLEKDHEGVSFEAMVRGFAESFVKDRRIKAEVKRECKACEYRMAPRQLQPNQKSGFDECWREATGRGEADRSRGLSLDIWSLHYQKKDALLKSRKFYLDQVEYDDLTPKKVEPAKEGDFPHAMTGLERKWFQVEKGKKKDPTPLIKIQELAEYLNTLEYPLHFIDFETTRSAIPFYQGRRPYEQVAFQFSHHVLQSNGKIEHRTQFLSFERGRFPNFEFVRALKKALEGDSGTIFRYADHENTVLREIRKQLVTEGAAVADSDELCRWIDSVTRWKEGAQSYQGNRCMVDMKKIIESYFYHPATNGSNSIKAVLPAVLNTSKYLQEKYSKAIYGSQAEGGIRSLNFKNHKWIQLKNDLGLADPYKSLAPVFTDIEMGELEGQFDPLYQSEEQIAEGGAAMTAFARMQFTQMANEERERVASALLKYCELDTFAMVMIFEYWLNEAAELKLERKSA